MKFSKDQLINLFSNPNLYKNTKNYINEIMKENEEIYKIVNNALKESLFSLKITPKGKIHALKFFKQVFQTGVFDCIEDLDQEIENYIIEVARYNKKSKEDKRGQKYFIEIQKRQNNSENIQFGISFVLFALQIIKNFADWYPKDFENEISRYYEYYTDLVKQGVIFPQGNIYFKEEDKIRFKENYKKWYQKDQQPQQQKKLEQVNEVANNQQIKIIKLRQKQITQLKQQIIKLKNYYKASQNQLIEKHKASQNQLIERYKAQIQANEKTQTNQIELKNKNIVIEKLQSEVQQLNKVNKQLQIQKKSLENKIIQLESQNEKRKSLMNINQTYKEEELQNFVIKLNEELTNKTNQSTNLTQNIKKLKKQLNQAKTQIKQLKIQNKILKQNIENQKKSKELIIQSPKGSPKRESFNTDQKQKRVYSISRTQKHIVDKKFRADLFQLDMNNTLFLDNTKAKNKKHSYVHKSFFKTRNPLYRPESPRSVFDPKKFCLSFYQGDVLEYNEQILKPLNLKMFSFRNACLGASKVFFDNNKIDVKILKKKHEFQIQVRNKSNKQISLDHKLVSNQSYSLKDMVFKQKNLLSAGKSFLNKICIFIQSVNFKYLSSLIRIDGFQINLFLPITLLDFCIFSKVEKFTMKMFKNTKTIKSIQFQIQQNTINPTEYFKDFCIQNSKSRFVAETLVNTKFNQQINIILKIIYYKNKCLFQAIYQEQSQQNMQFTYNLMSLLMFCFMTSKFQ